MADVFLDFGGRRRPSDPIHTRLAVLEAGAQVQPVRDGDRVFVANNEGK